MSCYIRSASVTQDGLVIYYDNHLPDGVVEEKVTVRADTVGGWYNLIFNPEQLKLYKFLDTMVVPDVETRRLQALKAVDEILMYDRGIDVKIDLMNSVTILDPTFTPPTINERCGWQNDLVDAFNSNWGKYVLKRCRNEKRIEEYFKYVKSL